MDSFFDVFHQNKAAMSMIKDPLMLLRHLKDNDIIKPKQFKTYDSNDKKDSMYKILESIQKRKRSHVEKFWKCVNQKCILENYPELSELTAKIWPESNSESNEAGPSSQSTKSPSKRAENKKKNESNKAGPTSQSTKSQKKIPEHKKRKEQENISDLIKHKKLLPVTCGNKEALLDRKGMSDGKKDFIRMGSSHITPTEFEKIGGKESQKDWKKSIKCYKISLKTLINVRTLIHFGNFSSLKMIL